MQAPVDADRIIEPTYITISKPVERWKTQRRRGVVLRRHFEAPLGLFSLQPALIVPLLQSSTAHHYNLDNQNPT